VERGWSRTGAPRDGRVDSRRRGGRQGRSSQRTPDSRRFEVTRQLLGSDVDDYLAISAVVAMFPEIDTLPSAQGQATIENRDRHRG
jgi:hypothetical protein